MLHLSSSLSLAPDRKTRFFNVLRSKHTGMEIRMELYDKKYLATLSTQASVASDICTFLKIGTTYRNCPNLWPQGRPPPPSYHPSCFLFNTGHAYLWPFSEDFLRGRWGLLPSSDPSTSTSFAKVDCKKEPLLPPPVRAFSMNYEIMWIVRPGSIDQ